MTGHSNLRLGVMLMIGATLVFSAQDGISRHLADAYNVNMIVMIRYWFFALFVLALAQRQAGGVRAAARTRQPLVQVIRALLLAFQICVMIASFTLLGLVESHAVFAFYPLIVAALSGPVLGEKVGWRRWVAIAVGFVGVLVILEPGYGVFDLAALVPLLAAGMFALYGLMTRYAGRLDTTATSLFWTGTVGALATTAIGLWFWEPMIPSDWMWMACLCVTGVLGHWLLIRCYEVAEASAVQPFAYAQLIFASLVGILVFDESLRFNVILGVAIIVSAGLFTFWRERQQA